MHRKIIGLLSVLTFASGLAAKGASRFGAGRVSTAVAARSPAGSRQANAAGADDGSLRRARHGGDVLDRDPQESPGIAEKLEKSTGVPVLVETIETLKGETIDEAAARHARRSGTQGVFILIARKESKIEVLTSRRCAQALPLLSRARVRSAFIEPFRKSNFDEGLKKGIEVLEAELARAKKEGKVPQAEKAEAGDLGIGRLLLPQEKANTLVSPATVKEGAGPETSAGQDKPLVIRNQVRLTLEGGAGDHRRRREAGRGDEPQGQRRRRG